ncbi:MAG: NAD(P)H-hydrate epimerase [Anaerolineales bacterium]
MSENTAFLAPTGQVLPALTEDQMREVDRIAMDEFGLGVLQMMENAGRNLALHAVENVGDQNSAIVIMAGSGGNGGGGICCARHLRNRGYRVELFLSKDPAELRGSAAAQYQIVEQAGLSVTSVSQAEERIEHAELVIDALIGYSLKGAPRGTTKDLIETANEFSARTLSLDIPSGFDSTTGETPGVAIRPYRTLTLALPKIGLREVEGELYVADIGIPAEVFAPLGISFEPFFGGAYWVQITASTGG